MNIPSKIQNDKNPNFQKKGKLCKNSFGKNSKQILWVKTC